MAIIAPFRAVRPKLDLASQVAAPPYDVVSLEEARNLSKGNPYSFLRVSRAELELDPDLEPYSDTVYAHGAKNLRNLINTETLIQEGQPMFGVYRQRWGTCEQTGLVALASVHEYDQGIIKKHELTRPVKESDRVKIIETHESQSGPVLLFFRRPKTFKNWLESVTNTSPDLQFVADDQVEHTVWSIRDNSEIHNLIEKFNDIEIMYIADGHHRSAAASRVYETRNASNMLEPSANEKGFLSVIFPHDELQILPYNRVVRDLNGMTPSKFHETLGNYYELCPTSRPGNPKPKGFDMYLNGQWHQATPLSEDASSMRGTSENPVASLAVSVLTEKVLEPLLGITDQRSDPRIDFVGGVRGTKPLEKMVDEGAWSVAFWLYPTTIEELMAVSDAECIMPPKSTWFEPKLRDGLFIHMLKS